MQNEWMETRWVSRATRAALVSALSARRGRRSRSGSGLRRAFESLCAEATATSQPPEAVLEVFRRAWDSSRLLHPDDDPRDLLYYGTLAECLDICFSRRGSPSARPATPADCARSTSSGGAPH